MSESILIAILAALGAVSAAVISVTSGRRLKRLVAVSEVLKDLPADDEAHATLLAVRSEDAVELRREQQSTFNFFVWTSLAALALSIVVTVYGEDLLHFSPVAYLALVVSLIVAALLLVLFYVASIVGHSVRLFRKLREWARTRRERHNDDRDIEDEALSAQSASATN